MRRKGVLLDIDGTLVDTAHLHTLSWWRAFRLLGETIPMSRIHRLIGMGGDQLVPTAVGHDLDGAEDAYGRAFEQLYDEVTVLPGARTLVERLVDAGYTVVLASSARSQDLERFQDLLDIDDLIAGATDSSDAEQTKPAADIFDAAMAAHDLDRSCTTVVGDTVWDGLAAARAGVAFLGVETGGNAHDALVGAGARAVYADVAAVADAIAEAPFADASR